MSRLFNLQKELIPEDHENQLLTLSLVGVVISENPSSSVAVIHNIVTGKTATLKAGESVLDMKLTHVFEDGIVFHKGDKIYWIFWGKGNRLKDDENIHRKPPKISQGGQGYDQPQSDQVIDDLPKMEFVRSNVQRRVKREWPSIIKKTQVVQEYRDGKMSGLRVVRLPAKSIASEIGIYKDDVIKEVNGLKLDDLSTLASLYSQIFVEDRFEVLIERDKKLIRQVYALR